MTCSRVNFSLPLCVYSKIFGGKPNEVLRKFSVQRKAFGDLENLKNKFPL